MKKLIKRFNDRYTRYLIAADIPYSDNSTLDIYATPASSQEKRPIIFFWYGGSWQGGDKATYRFVADYLARKTGALIVVPNYEKYPAVRYPHFIDEAWQAVSLVRSRAHEYNADPTRYSVVGHSSGAHTACSIALGHRIPTGETLPVKCVSLAGPNVEVGKSLWPVFGITNHDFSAFPDYFVNHDAQPSQVQFMLLHGLLDTIVHPKQFSTFRASLVSKQIAVIAIRPFTTHPGLVIGLGSPFARWTVYAGRVVNFLKSK